MELAQNSLHSDGVRGAGVGSQSVDRQPSVILVDDHGLFRAGLRNLLEGEGIKVVADSAGSADIVQRVRASGAQVAVMNVRFEHTDAFAAMSELTSGEQPVRIVALARGLDDADLYRSVRAGATGFVLKDSPIGELAGTIRAVNLGLAHLVPTATASMLRFVRSGRVPRIDETEMSDREVDVLRLVAAGLDNNEIAAELNISSKTVKNHISSIFTKLSMRNRVEAAVYAVRTGIA